MTRRLVAATVGALLVLLVGPAAHALDLPGPLPEISLTPDVPPTLESPYDTGAYELDKGPSSPRTGDPWEPGGPSIYERYGYAGIEFDTYGLGIGVDSAAAAGGTSFANSGMRSASWMVAFTGSTARFAYNPDQYTRPLKEGVETTNEKLTVPWMLIAGALFIAAGVALAVTTRGDDYATSTTALGLTVGVLLGGVLLLAAPTRATEWVYDTYTGVMNGIQSAVSGDDGPSELGVGFTATQHESILYEAWLAGTFGRANSDAAREFGPRLFDASAMTYDEAARATSDPGYARQLTEEKAEAWVKAFTELEEKYPWVAPTVKGEDPGGRILAAALANLGAFTTSAPQLLASWLMIVFFVALIVFTLIGGWLLLGALFKPLIVIAAAGFVTSVGLNGIVFGSVTALFTVAAGALIGPAADLAGWQAGLLLVAVAGALWLMTRRYRRIDKTGKSRAFLRDVGGKAVHLGTTWLGSHHGAQSGVAAGMAQQAEQQTEQPQQEQRGDGRYSHVYDTSRSRRQQQDMYMQPLPPPPAEATAEASVTVTQQPRTSGDPSAPGPAALPAPPLRPLEAVPVVDAEPVEPQPYPAAGAIGPAPFPVDSPIPGGPPTDHTIPQDPRVVQEPVRVVQEPVRVVQDDGDGPRTVRLPAPDPQQVTVQPGQAPPPQVTVQPGQQPAPVTVLAPDIALPGGIREVYPVADSGQDVYPLYGTEDDL